ncbi:MAG TPA: helix-turn-helix domain-containing protein [Candidatus Dormibacteraeota bacterium]|jgi:sugar-specific transcriptional regulator TrmB|nr:helix-turn-helix domain-containing protein [Candidatus Dormibacteraeota bacterium]
MSDSVEQIALRLAQLGFSQYEARTYVGLLVTQDATGYAISNQTGVPQPKVYETLRRLVERGAVVQTGQRPARYVAVPPGQLLAALEANFRSRLESARRGLESLPRGDGRQPLAVSHLDRFEAVVERAREAIGRAQSRVYLHGRSGELSPLAEAVGIAVERGVRFVIVHFGPLPFPRPRGQVVRHASTEGTLYSSRQVRHLAAVADSRWSLWALARDGERWEGLYSDSSLLASLVKTYIRHDLFVQRIYADLPDALEARYGPGLLRLADFSADAEEADERAEGAG